MPRANRYRLSGFCWHLTRRCHDREFLLEFIRDRQCYEHWLAQAKLRHDLSELQEWQSDTITEALRRNNAREPCWTEPIAVGSRPFLDSVADSLRLPDHKHPRDNLVLHEAGSS